MDFWDISCPLIMETWAATAGAALSNSRDSRPSTTGRTFLRRAWRGGSDIVSSPCLDDIENGHEFDVDTRVAVASQPISKRRGTGARLQFFPTVTDFVGVDIGIRPGTRRSTDFVANSHDNVGG